MKLFYIVMVVCAVMYGCGSREATEERAIESPRDPGKTEQRFIIQHKEQIVEQAYAGGAVQACSLAVRPLGDEYRTQFCRRAFAIGRSGRLVTEGMRPVREIELKAFQYGFSPSTIRVARGERVRLVASTLDVAHGIYIREYGINVPLHRGERKVVEFTADRSGEFLVQCSVYCGRGFSHMRARLVVDK